MENNYILDIVFGSVFLIICANKNRKSADQTCIVFRLLRIALWSSKADAC